MEQRVIEVLKSEPKKGAATLLISKKLGVTPITVRRVFSISGGKGIIEKKDGNYRL